MGQLIVLGGRHRQRDQQEDTERKRGVKGGIVTGAALIKGNRDWFEAAGYHLTMKEPDGVLWSADPISRCEHGQRKHSAEHSQAGRVTVEGGSRKLRRLR